MHLFELTNFKVTFSPQALMLKPFRAIWDHDKSKHKDIAVKELSFVWFFCDILSSYLFIKNETERTQEIKKDVELPKTWKPSKLVKEAIDFYISNETSMANSIYKAAISSVDIVTKKLNSTEELIKNSGDEILAITKLTTLLEKLPKVMVELKKAERQVIKEQTEKQEESQNLFENSFDKIF